MPQITVSQLAIAQFIQDFISAHCQLITKVYEPTLLCASVGVQRNRGDFMGRIERRLRADFDGSGIGRRNVVIVLARSPKSRLPEPERAVTRAPRQGTGLALKDAKESRGVTGVTTRTADTSPC